MKKLLFGLSFILSINAGFAQFTVSTLQDFKLKNTHDTINSLQVQDNGLRPISISINFKARKQPGRQNIIVDLVDLESIKSKPKLLDSIITINAFTRIDSMNWEGKGVCNIQLIDSSKGSDKFYLTKKGDINNRTSITVCQFNFDSVRNISQASVSKNSAKVSQHVSLDNASTLFNPIYAKDSIRTERVLVKMFRDTVPSNTDTDKVTLTIEKYTFPFNPQIISTKEIKISDWDVKHDSSGKATVSHTEVIVINNESLATDLKMDLSSYLKIDGNNKSFHEIRLTEKGMYNSSRPFWMETGTNFDLLDGIKANNLYAGIYMFEKDIAGKYKKQNRVSFTGGVYESKSSSFSSGSDSGYIYRDGSSYNPIEDSQTNSSYYRYYRDTGSVTTTTEVQSIGIFFSPHWRLSQKSSDEYGFHMYTSLFFEMLWQRVNSKYDFSNTGRDSVYRVNNMGEIYNYPFKENNTSYDYRTQYIGIGLPMYITHNLFNLYINSVFGGCNQRFVAIQDSGLSSKRSNAQQIISARNGLTTPYQNPKRSWNPFYLLQFRLTEETYGLVFIGEVRGFLLKNSKPVISLSLSKKFDLAELFKTIVKPFTPGKTGS